MNSQLRIFGTIILVLSAATFAVGQNPVPPPTTGTLPMYDRLEFPEVEGWELGERSPLPAGDDGIFINYDSRGGERVTIYVYRRGDDIPNKLSGVVKDEFDGARDAIKTVADAGVYTDLKQSKGDTVTLGTTGTVKALHVQMTFKVRGVPLKSEIYVFPYKGHVAKIRASRPAAADKTSDESYARLLAAIDQFFSK